MGKTLFTRAYPDEVTSGRSASFVGKAAAVALFVLGGTGIFMVGRAIDSARFGDGLTLETWQEDIVLQDDGRCFWEFTAEVRNQGEEQFDLILARIAPGGLGLRHEFDGEPLPKGDSATIDLFRPMATCEQTTDDFRHGQLLVTYVTKSDSNVTAMRFNIQVAP